MSGMRTAAKYAAEGCIIKPLLLRYFQDSDTIKFDFHVEWTRNREPDGWFHSSAHPYMSEDDLVSYLMLPPKSDKMEYVSTMSTLFGSVMHGVIDGALGKMGIVVPLPPGPCIVCGLPRPRQGKTTGICREHGARDEKTRSRGHLDAILNLREHGGIYGFDMKTIKPYGAYGLKDAPDMNLEYFKSQWPKYYAQGQDYMRMTGIRRFIVFFMTLGNPWEMREYHFSFDPKYAAGIEARYLNALRRAGIGS